MLIPDDKACEELMDLYKLPESTRRHCAAVADTANRIGLELINAGVSVNLELLRAASLLHDLRRELPNHANTASKLLSELGMLEVADIVAEHMDLRLSTVCPPYEKYIVYLADKLVCEDKFVGIEKRFEKNINSSDIKTRKAAAIRKNVALSVECQIKELCNGSPAKPKQKLFPHV